MPLFALCLVLVAAITHASWNLLAKQAANCRHFVLLYSIWAVSLWAPAALWVLMQSSTSLGPWSWASFVGTGLLHITYSLCLQRGYRVADLSVVYPIARGTGPLVSFVGAVALLGERPSIVAAIGALLVVGGVFVMATSQKSAPGADSRKGVLYGIATGFLVASYTVWDGWAVKSLLVPPLLLDFVGNVIRCAVLLPAAVRDTDARRELRNEHRIYWKQALGVSILAPLGYILVLYATRLASVSRVAPARELSMMVGAYLGARFLGEQDIKRRVVASALIVVGVLALAFG